MGFLESKSYCDFCPLETAVKKKQIKRACKNSSFEIVYNNEESKNNLDVLVITDLVERPEDSKKLIKYINNLGITNFALTSALGCRTFDYKVTSPIYELYNHCQYLDVSKLKPKVVLTFGRSFNYFTPTSVFQNETYFNEVIFNETWFLPKYLSKTHFRIYPTYFLHNVFVMDSFENLHFKKQLENIKAYLSNYEPVIIEETTITKVTDFKKFCEDNKNQRRMAIDTETNSLNVFIDDFKIGCVTISFDGKEGFYIPFDIIDKDLFKEFLSNKFLIWANGKYDSKGFQELGIPGIRVDEDINLLFHLMNTERDSNRLKLLAWFIGFGDYDSKLSIYIKKNKIKNYLDIPEAILMEYATLDAIVTFRLWEYARKYLIPKQPDTYQLYRDVLIPFIPVVQAMETEGILIDREYHAIFHEELQERKKTIEQEIYDIAGKKFSISSNDALGKVLESMGLKDYGRTKKGLFKTGEEILQKWKNDNQPIAIKILEYRQVSKLDNTFVGSDNKTEEEPSFLEYSSELSKPTGGEGLAKFIMSDNRIHGTVMPALTRSWRNLSFDPNTQNFVKHGEDGKKFRKIFIPPKDFLLSEADYSGFQLRLMGIYSQDTNMIKAFTEHGGDLHSVTGNDIFANDVSLEYFLAHKKEEPYKTARYNGKTTNLAFAFNQSPYSFQNTIKQEWSKEHIDEYLKDPNVVQIKDNKTNILNPYLTIASDINDKFFIKYPDLKQYITDTQNFAKKHGYVECPIFKGIRRHIPNLLQQSNKLSREQQSYYSGLTNISSNSGAQGGEAVLIDIAITKIHNEILKRGLKSRLIATVHDSVVSYIHKTEIKEMYYLLKESMEINDYAIPIVIEIEMGMIWGFSEEVDENNLEEVYKKYNETL